MLLKKRLLPERTTGSAVIYVICGECLHQKGIIATFVGKYFEWIVGSQGLIVL